VSISMKSILRKKVNIVIEIYFQIDIEYMLKKKKRIANFIF
jgi:hypothetical protein